MTENNKIDIYKAMKEERQQRHQKWNKLNKDILFACGLKYKQTSSECFTFRNEGKPKVDFYPSTGRWRDTDLNKTYSGGAKQFVEWYNKQKLDKEGKSL